MTALCLALCALGAVVLLIAAVGLVRLPDALTRQHAATKAGTLGVSLFALGVAVAVADPAWTWRILSLVLLVLITLPLASHALARAAVREAGGTSGEGGGAPRNPPPGPG